MHDDIKTYGLLLGFKFLRLFTNILLTSLTVRLLGPNGTGEWALVVAAGTLLHSVLLNWMHAPTVRFGREEWRAQGFISEVWASRVPFLVLGLAASIFLIRVEPFQWLRYFFHLSDDANFVILMSLTSLWLAAEAQNCMQIRGAVWMMAVMPVFVDSISLFFLLLISPKFVGQSPMVIIAVLLAVSTLVWGLVYGSERRKLRINWQWPSISGVGKVSLYAWPLIPGFALGYASDWCDVILIRNFLSVREVGLFQSAYQFMMMFQCIASPISVMLLPRLIDKQIEDDESVKNFLVASGPTIVILGLLLLVPLVSIAPVCFPVFMGQQFLEAEALVPMLCIAIPGSVISVFYGAFFSLQGRLLRCTVLYVGLMSVINVILSLLLLPRIGIAGAAIATGVSYLFVQFMYMYDQHRHYGAPLAKGFAAFGGVVAFALLQACVDGGWGNRLLLCGFSLAMIVILTRLFQLIDRNLVTRIFFGPFTGLGRMVVRISCS